MFKKARKTDSHSHGGSIINGSPNVFANGLNVARIGDPAACPIHGLVSVASGCPTVLANGIPIARTDCDHVTCGGLITTGSGNVKLCNEC